MNTARTWMSCRSKYLGFSCTQEGENVVLIADIGGTNCRFELWDIDLQDRTQHRELFHIVRRPRVSALPAAVEWAVDRDKLARMLAYM